MPYFLMALLFIALAALQALDVSLFGFDLLPWLQGTRWLRVHLITLGVMSELIFGVLPGLVALRYRLPRPSFRWDIWSLLNIGILLLLVGIPLVSKAPIYAGGAAVFGATLLLMRQLSTLRPERSVVGSSKGRKFYLAGLSFFLIGIIIGTGLWFGWTGWLQIKTPVETHIHANSWGLMSLVLAGLIFDLYPSWTGRSLAWPQSDKAIFVMMTLGALGLVVGPWVNSLLFLVPGLILHVTATVWLLLNVIRPIRRTSIIRTPGVLHLLTGYVWLLVPIAMAPLIIFNVPGIPGADIEANAPQALIYGWLLMEAVALLPYFFTRLFQPEQTARLGGNWFSLVALHLGAILLWIGIFAVDARAVLHASAYLVWAVATIPTIVALLRSVQAGLARWERLTPAAEWAD